MDYKIGDVVKHPNKSDWGLGEVLGESDEDKLRVFFENAGDKTLSLKYVQLIKVEGNIADNRIRTLHSKIDESRSKYYKELSDPEFERLLTSAPRFNNANEAACYILDKTNGSCKDEHLNAFVLIKTNKKLLNTQQQNRNRVKKYRSSWEKHRHCGDMG